MQDALRDLYQEVILDHGKNPVEFLFLTDRVGSRAGGFAADVDEVRPLFLEAQPLLHRLLHGEEAAAI